MLSEGGWGRQAGKEKPEHLVCQPEPQLPFGQCQVEPILGTLAFSHQEELVESSTITKKYLNLKKKKGESIFKRAKSALVSKLIYLIQWQVAAQPGHGVCWSSTQHRAPSPGGDSMSPNTTGVPGVVPP